MHKYIYWHAFFKVNREEKVHKLLTRFNEVCDMKGTLVSCERYWKDSSLFDVVFSTPLNKDEIADAVFAALVISHKLAYQWEVTGPYISEPGMWGFRGLTTKTKVTGIEWIEFRVESEISD
ncbi:hypothetical protein [Paenibacillus harenae]|uniref:Uncharacterized protein n=1 Tax=Paenibacillus harenae TaxID=306543 RepID=A0ABT9U4W2_PAEHA|nr:hypothetical protein [Paenibacillus harenae]MDQ0062700.1 hypothetical protein [Paenibacillus harenae]MDQ0114038.1 hypothetical protein [Paenibacillus harenae]